MNKLLANSYRNIKEIILEAVNAVEGARVLDIGCGKRGNFCSIDPKFYYGMDKDAGVINYLNKEKNGSFFVMDSKELKFDSEYFDFVMNVSLLHHLSPKDMDDAVVGIKRVLKEKGKVIFCDGVYPQSKLNIAGWLIRFFDKGRYVRNKDDLRGLLLEYFRIDKEYYFVDKIFAYSLFVMSLKG